jgi:hypothetical protein
MVKIVPGMVIGTVLDNNGRLIKEAAYPVPYVQFSYVVSEVLSSGIYVQDTGHNNRWFIAESGLQFFELINEWHPHGEIDASYVNDQLRKY